MHELVMAFRVLILFRKIGRAWNAKYGEFLYSLQLFDDGSGALLDFRMNDAMTFYGDENALDRLKRWAKDKGLEV